MAKKKFLFGCKFCGKDHEIHANQKDMDAWKSGAHIQTVMSYLTADERELMISGMCGDCWNKTFGSDED